MAHKVVNGFCAAGCKVPVAPENHASAGTEYGLASETQYGHVKLMPIQFEAVGDGFKVPDGEIITYEDLKGYAASAFSMCALQSILTVIYDDYDAQIFALGEALESVRNAHIELKARVDGLVDAEGVEF